MSGQARHRITRGATWTPVSVGARVEQVAVAKERDALADRLHQHGVVISLGGLDDRGSRLRVRFDGESEPASIRPHLLRVVNS